MVKQFDPAGLVPPFGAPGNVTYVIRDEDDRSQIRAMIHAETAVEVRAMLVDPGYSHSQISYTVLHRGMEMIFRANGVQRYYFSANKDNKRAITTFEKDGAEVIDAGVTRFMKRL